MSEQNRREDSNGQGFKKLLSLNERLVQTLKEVESFDYKNCIRIDENMIICHQYTDCKDLPTFWYLSCYAICLLIQEKLNWVQILKIQWICKQNYSGFFFFMKVDENYSTRVPKCSWVYSDNCRLDARVKNVSHIDEKMYVFNSVMLHCRITIHHPVVSPPWISLPMTIFYLFAHFKIFLKIIHIIPLQN